MNLEFKTQMEFVRERNRIKYENKLMKDEDDYSQILQSIFKYNRELEFQKKQKEKELLLEQIRIQEQIEKERHELVLFIDEYVANKIEKLYEMNQYDINFDRLRREAENIFYERKLKIQQDEEYNKSIINDMRIIDNLKNKI
jgi:hypothetical protein